jgi:hypothetical protein
MKKIVINNCYGGFSLSKKAMELYSQLSGEHKTTRYGYDLRRDDPHLITVVETLKGDANGTSAHLIVVEVPEGVRCRIVEPDAGGRETIEREDQIVWDY